MGRLTPELSEDEPAGAGEVAHAVGMSGVSASAQVLSARWPRSPPHSNPLQLSKHCAPFSNTQLASGGDTERDALLK